MARSAQISRAARVRKRFTGKNRRQRHAAARPLAAYGLSRLYAPRARGRAAVVLAPSCLDPASGAAPAEAVVTTHPLLLCIDAITSGGSYLILNLYAICRTGSSQTYHCKFPGLLGCE